MFSSHIVLYFGTEIAKRKRHSMQPCKFLTDNNARWITDRVYKYFAGGGKDYRSYDADKTTGESVKDIWIKSVQESFRNMSLHTWINRFTLHNSVNISLPEQVLCTSVSSFGLSDHKSQFNNLSAQTKCKFEMQKRWQKSLDFFSLLEKGLHQCSYRWLK